MKNIKLGIMGDPHGHYNETLDLLKRTGFIDEKAHWIGHGRRLVCVGDYVDRGPDGLKTIELFMRLQKEAVPGAVIPMLGNHDVLILSAYFLGSEPCGGPAGTFYEDWVTNGGVPEELTQLTPEHIEWLRELPAMVRIDDVLITHADSMLYMKYGKTVEEVNATFKRLLQTPDPVEWDLFLEHFSDRLAFHKDPGLVTDFLDQFGGKILIHGHTPISYMHDGDVSAPYHYADGCCINVDACAYKGNPLVMHLV